MATYTFYLGEKYFPKYLQFVQTFRVENGAFLAEKLRVEHERGKSLELLEALEGEIKTLISDIEPISDASINSITGRLKVK